MSCKCQKCPRRRCCKNKRAKHTFVAGANACSSFNNILVCCSYARHDCNPCG